MPLGADDHEAAIREDCGAHLRRGERAAELDINAAPREVRGDRHAPHRTRLGDNLAFALMILRVQHFMRHSRTRKIRADRLIVFNGDSADEYRLSLRVPLLHRARDGAILPCARLEDEVVIILPCSRLVGRDRDDLKSVDGIKFFFRGERRTGHAGEPLIHAEEILEGYGRIGACFLLNSHALLGLNRLMQTLRPAAAGLEPPRKFVHYNYFPITNDVLFIFLEEGLRAHCRFQMVCIFHAALGVEVLQTERDFGLMHPRFGNLNRFLLFINRIILVFLHLADNACKALIKHLRIIGGPRDDERGARLVNQNGVHFVNNRVVIGALYDLRCVVGGVVAQVIKAEFVVGHIGNVAGIRFILARGPQIVVEHFERTLRVALGVLFF